MIPVYRFSLRAMMVMGFFACQSATTTDTNSKSMSITETQDEAVAPASTRYGIKSGIIHKKIVNSMMKGENTITVWFDRYGEVEVSENYTRMEMMGQKIEETTWSSLRDGILYTYKVGEKTGTKLVLSQTFDPKNVDWSKLTDELMKQYHVEKAGTEAFLGKTCDVYKMNNTEMGMVGKYLLWKNIVLKTETKMSGFTVVEEVTKLDENATITAEKFELPKDVTWQEIKMPGK